jgi:hypothetical protein
VAHQDGTSGDSSGRDSSRSGKVIGFKRVIKSVWRLLRKPSRATLDAIRSKDAVHSEVFSETDIFCERWKHLLNPKISPELAASVTTYGRAPARSNHAPNLSMRVLLARSITSCERAQHQTNNDNHDNY